MKKIISLHLFFFMGISLFGQLQLDVEGDALIRNRLIIGNPTDLNMFIGIDAGSSTTPSGPPTNNGVENTFVGNSAGVNNTTGSYNLFLGFLAGHTNSTGTANTFLGTRAGFATTSGNDNTFIGDAAGQNNITGHVNTFIGKHAGFQQKEGGGNVFIGYAAGWGSDSTHNIVAIGHRAGFHNKGFNNLFVGGSAGEANTTGVDNTFVGYIAGEANTTGEQNDFIGGWTGISNTTGAHNVFVGHSAGRENVTGNHNTFVGNFAGSRSKANFNTFVGANAGESDTTGMFNAFFGAFAGVNTSSGSYNTMLGHDAGLNNQNGHSNAFLGQGAGAFNVSGFENTFIGRDAGNGSEFGNHNSCLGAFTSTKDTMNNQSIHNATAIGYLALSDANDKVRIGNKDVMIIEGAVNFSTTSDKRYKKNIKKETTTIHHNFILNLSPVSYQFKSNKSRLASSYSGFLAQEVEKAAKKTGYQDFSGIVKPEINGGKYALRYAEFVVPLVGAVQEQQKTIEDQQAQITQRDEKIEQLTADVAELKEMLQTLIADQKTKSTQAAIIQSAKLGQNAPNPFNGITKIPYFIPINAQQASLLVYNLNGQLLKSIAIQNFGEGVLELQTNELSNGQYTYSLEINGRIVSTKKMNLVK